MKATVYMISLAWLVPLIYIGLSLGWCCILVSALLAKKLINRYFEKRIASARPGDQEIDAIDTSVSVKMQTSLCLLFIHIFTSLQALPLESIAERSFLQGYLYILTYWYIWMGDLEESRYI